MSKAETQAGTVKGAVNMLRSITTRIKMKKLGWAAFKQESHCIYILSGKKGLCGEMKVSEVIYR